MSIEEQRRKAFEAHYSDINLERNEYWPDFYVNLTTRMCWEAWNAALDSVVVELPPSDGLDYCPSVSYDYSAGYRAGIKASQQAIHAAGVKTK
jgi:hypothetical protein